MTPASPYMTTAEAAAYLRFRSVGAFYVYRHELKQRGKPLKAYRRGGVMLFRQRDLDASLYEEQLPRPALQRVR